MNKIILLILCTYLAKSCGQCNNDKNYKFYRTLIQHERDDIRRVFDGILEKYGDVDKILQDLLNKLNNTINSADSRLGQLEKYNRDIRKSNNDSNSKLEPLLISLKVVEDGLKLIKFNKTWPEEKEEAEKSANKTVPRPATTDIPEQEEELAKWPKFLNELNDSDGASDVMNVPHSVSSELDLLEKLIEGPAINCFDKLQNDLKLLFTQLANLFDLSTFKDDIDNIKVIASKNKKNAADIFSGTKDFLEKEKALEDIYYLTNETLALAEEIEKLKNSIKDTSGHNEEIINEKLKKLYKEHEAEVEKLNKKYNVAGGQLLLDELRRIKQQIEDVNIANVEKDIDDYIRDINYYTCVLEKCESGADAIASCRI